jgi:uncharacterized protein YhaN
MRLCELFIDGYGRLSDCSLGFEPGLQVVIGPNERGKSTVRCFVTDMLYGQKRDGAQALYEESNALRLPWTRPECYGGRLLYELDNGARVEVRRTFHRGREQVRVADMPQDRDITASFPLLANREIDFARAHLGLGKAVFVNAATIGHLSLDGLGDQDALDEIRDRLLAIADSGAGGRSADAALRALAARIEAVGRADARNRPLPAALARLAALNEEHARTAAARRELADLARRRGALKRRAAELDAERALVENATARARAHRRAARLQDAERIQQRIDEITQRCFQLGPFRDTPLDRLPEAQQSRMHAETARLQVERREQEMAELSTQIEAERLRGAEDTVVAPLPVPEAVEFRYHELRGMTDRIDERVTDAESRLRQIEEQVVATQKRLADLPDFGRETADPIEWLTQLQNSFTLAQRAREEAVRELERLEAEVGRRRAAIAPDAELFSDCESFSDRLREFDHSRRQAAEKRVETENLLHTLRGTRDELKERIPGLALLSGVCAASILLLLGLLFLSGKMPILIAVSIIFLALGYFLYHLVSTRTRMVEMTERVAVIQGDLDMMDAADPGLSPVEMMLKRAECPTLRELEGCYDRYREANAQLNAVVNELERQETVALECEDRVPKLYERLSAAFQRFGETLRDEDDVHNAVGRVMARYQEYRDAKRRMADLRSTMQSAIENLRELREALQTTQDALALTEAQIRGIMREGGFAEEQGMADTLSALRAYGEHTAQRQARISRMGLLREQADTAQRLLMEDRAEELSRRRRLEELLETAGAASVEEWQERTEKAREYRGLQETRVALEEQLAALLEGGTLTDLRRAAIEAEAEAPAETLEMLEADLARVTAETEAARQEMHALALAAAEKGSGQRPLSEVEEDRATVEAAVRALELEFEAAAQALAVIEDVAVSRHARIAPIVAREASACLHHVTGGVHGDLVIGPDFRISLRTAGPASSEKSLSKGALDQLYLSLRIALVRFLCDDREAVPMLFDDPFANYDDQRLRAAMELLRDVGRRHQVLLFTCREDVAAVATELGAPVLTL